jgi:hypothetical protein
MLNQLNSLRTSKTRAWGILLATIVVLFVMSTICLVCDSVRAWLSVDKLMFADTSGTLRQRLHASSNRLTVEYLTSLVVSLEVSDTVNKATSTYQMPSSYLATRS